MPHDKEMRVSTPPHPGRFVRTAIIKPLGISVKDAARVLGIHRVALSRFLNEQASLSSEMAIRLEKAFGASMEDLMRMQNNYDIARAYKRRAQIKVARYVPTDMARAEQIQLF